MPVSRARSRKEFFSSSPWAAIFVDAGNPVLKALSAPMPMLAFKAALWRV